MRKREVYITDRMSQLPEFISHHIMSFLYSPKDRVRMSVLSKYWFGITASFPILDFDIRKFKGFKCFYNSHKNRNNCIDKFYKYVEYATSRFCRHQNVTTARTFKLITSVWDATQVDSVDKCLELFLIKGGVQVLVIDIRAGPMDRDYRLSSKLLVSSASSLTSLKIRSCELPSSFLVDNVIAFKSLKRLKLKLVPDMDDNMLKRLTTGCPLLEELIVKYCHGLKSLCVYELQNLQQVKFFFSGAVGVDRIDIEAPNLCLLTLSRLRGRAPCLNVASCKKLTTVCYNGDPSPTRKALADFSSGFPYLKTLFLDLPDICGSLKLSSHSLTTFVLQSRKCDLEQLDVDTPNLLSFEYTYDSLSPFAVKRDSISSKSRMECHPSAFADALWFKKLRTFLDKKVRFKELKLCLRACSFEVEGLRMIQSPPFELDHVDLEPDLKPSFLKRDLSAYLALVDGVLWCCRPRSLTLESGFSSIHFEEWSQIVKFTFEKLLIQEDQGQTNIHIVTSSSSNAKEHFSDLTSLLTALPRDGLRPITTFIKEQGPVIILFFRSANLMYSLSFPCIVNMQTVVQEAG